MPSLWESAISSIAQRMSDRNFELWIQPLRFVSLHGDVLTLQAPNLYLKEWFEDNYLHSVRNELARCAGRSVDIQVLLGAPEPRGVEPPGIEPPGIEPPGIEPPGAISANEAPAVEELTYAQNGELPLSPADALVTPPAARQESVHRAHLGAARGSALGATPESAPKPTQAATQAATQGGARKDAEGDLRSALMGASAGAVSRTTTRSDLCARYRFEHFVVGPSNQFAATAAELVAERPGEKYNPLFLYGGTGLGKTHLLQAIGHALLDRHPTWQVTYVSSERFMNEFIGCLRMKKMEEFRERYRQRCDVLLMDDVQFIAGKDNTENEFFHTFNALHEQSRQIVLTSDKVVSELPELRDRLKSRFQWGLMADILPPELDTRISILKQKARQDRIPLPDDVATFLATNIQSNVRELEGALIRLAAFSSLQGLAITVEFAERTLAGVLQRTSSKITVERIQREVASYFNIRQSDLKSARRPRVISFPRQVAMHLCRKHTASSLTEIGRQFGGKDHTTVLSADRKMRRLVGEEDELRTTVKSIEHRLGV